MKKSRNTKYYNREEYIRRSLIIRREKVLMEKIVLSFLFFITLLVSVMFISSKVSAGNFKNKSSEDSVKMYKSIMVYAGDTFESIAEQYMTDEYSSEVKYIKEVLSINGMTEASKLVPGNNIIIPYYMSESIINQSYDPVIEISLAQ